MQPQVPGWYDKEDGGKAYWNGAMWDNSTVAPNETHGDRTYVTRGGRVVFVQHKMTFGAVIAIVVMALIFAFVLLSGKYNVPTGDFERAFTLQLQEDYANVTSATCDDGGIIPWTISLDEDKTYECTVTANDGTTRKVEAFIDTLHIETRDRVPTRNDRNRSRTTQVLESYTLDYRFVG